jgi:hypothetical protein
VGYEIPTEAELNYPLIKSDFCYNVTKIVL